MVIAQAIVEHGLLDSLVAAFQTAVDQVDYYVGAGNAKWVLIGLAVVLAAVFFKPSRR
jgi:type IV secretory pathway TrbL component